jgi:tetratricopeptide (TPR) repeat protein/tRNA A-37 threonylcarbamoyl transferase component Bud32
MKDVSKGVWPTEEAVFNAARKIADVESRRAYMDHACGGDAALLARVRALLDAHEGAGGFMQSPVGHIGLTPQQQAALCPASPGSTIGRYTLVQLIGEGAFGWVYRAEQRHPVRRTVALKILKAGMESPQVIARFEAERQALALMDHPNIAKVLDTGATDAGRPYFVMELVEGTPITGYCDEHRLSPRQRLDLFVQVCHAVQHAHQKGIIHRDLKPSNVLVALYDGKPVPKVIDFGVSKATGPSLLETMHTGLGQMIGTLEYMSPEQAELNRADVDTRTDVYSLGVLLYELLTGTTPLEGRRLKESPLLDALRVIREEEPPRPSTRLSTIATIPSVAASRGVEPKKLSRAVRGELDWIVMKCLEKDRARRYETANGLARDIERHLHDEPVSARPAGRGYRLRKFVRRNRLGVMAASAVVVALVGGIIGTSWGMVRATRAQAATLAEALRRSRAEAATKLERDKAVDAEADTAAFSTFLVDHVLAAARAKKDGGLGENVTVADAIAAAETKIDKVFAGRPKAEAVARQSIGITWKNLGRDAEAETNLRRAVALREQYLGPDSAATLDSINVLADFLRNSRDLAEAESLFRKALENERRIHGEKSASVALLLNYLALVLCQKGDLGGGKALYQQAMEMDVELLGEESPVVAKVMHNLALLLERMDDLAGAEKLYLRSLEICRKVLPAGHSLTLFEINALAEIYDRGQRFDEEESLYRESLPSVRASRGDADPDMRNVLNNLSDVRRRRAMFGENEQVLIEALQGAVVATSSEYDRLSPDHPWAAGLLAMRANSYARLRRFEEAAADYARALKLDPTDQFRWQESASIAAYLGKKEDFAAQCQAVLNRFGDTTDRDLAERTVRLIGSVPTDFSGVPPQRLVELADRAVAAEAPHRWNYFQVGEAIAEHHVAKGIAEYRAGKFESAVKWLLKGRGEPPEGDRAEKADVFLAMALHRLGRTGEAAESLRRATQAMDRRFPSTGVYDLGFEFQNYLCNVLARREAEQLLGIRTEAGNEGTNEVQK